MGKNKVNFTAELLRNASCDTGKKRSIYYDNKQPGLALLVSPTGVKTFALHAYDRTRKKAIQHTIARYPDITIKQARDTANTLLGELANSVDIKSAARAIREEPTVDEIFNQWITLAERKKRSWKDDDSLYLLHIKPVFGEKQISTITPQQVRTWHSKLPTKNRQRKTNGKKVKLTKATANRCLALLRAIYNQEADHLPNPCKRVKLFPEESRNRFLTPTEIKSFFNALGDDETPQALRDLVHLLLFTGARRSNLLSMQWKEVDFSSTIWTIPPNKSKNKKAMPVPLVGQALEILTRRKKETSSIFVFPGDGKTGHLVEPKRAWKSMVKRSGLENVRLHDLRRTCGSYQAASGTNQAVISKSLGHQNIATTAIYTRFDLDPVRASMERAANAMQDAASGGNKVVKLGD